MVFSSVIKWFFPAKRLTTLVWIIFPFFYILFAALNHYQEPFFDVTLYGLPISSNHEVAIIIPPYPFIIWLLYFAVYPAIYPTHKFYSKRGSENVVIEYAFLKKILYSSIIILIFIIIFTQYIGMIIPQDIEIKKLSKQIDQY